MSKALVAFVWLAGPLTGVFVQPYIGILSDRSRISWGKRKPFMVAGALGTVVASITVSYARDIIRVIGGLAKDAHYDGCYKTATIILATIMMWCLDFAINAVQAAIRAFIVDNAPSHQQESANAWASRMTGVGNVLGYIFGYLNLPQYMSFFGNTQFKVLCVIASIAMSFTVLISVLSIKERNPQLDPPSRSDHRSSGILTFFKDVFLSIKRLPPETKTVCKIQFFHWMGWFPFLFYITTYIGQLYVNPYLKTGLSDLEVNQLWNKATRIGTLALLIYAITSFVSNLILPFLVVPTYVAQTPHFSSEITRPLSPSSPIGVRVRTASWGELAMANNRTLSTSSNSHLTQGSSFKPPNLLNSWLERLQIPGLTLRRAWLLSQLLFSLCTFSTFFISTPQAATVMTGVIGITWSLTLWAPFALISAELARRDERRRRRDRERLMNDPDEEDAEGEDEGDDRAGIILGIHNVAVSSPQVLATIVCSLVFKLLQKPRNVPGDVSVGWTLRLGGLATLISAFMTWRMKGVGDEDLKK
ncbi:hypothetical protein LTR84_012425 [Exophiala bonariae]|uniref:Sucrose transporter n=1 Tax=Exophiala bonariae TaxID=1690606 RepID=A0AAV9MT11_9EURO|nr:hypothetical protein LTR84_012425 [Exophiala bonariae]